MQIRHTFTSAHTSAAMPLGSNAVPHIGICMVQQGNDNMPADRACECLLVPRVMVSMNGGRRDEEI